MPTEPERPAAPPSSPPMPGPPVPPSLRAHIILLVVAAALLPVVVGVLAVSKATPKEDAVERDEHLVRATAWMLMRDLTGTSRSFEMGTELFDMLGLSSAETTGVLRMLYKQDEDVDIVLLLRSDDRPVVEPVFLRADQIQPGTETAGRLPVDEADLTRFLENLPLEAARQNQRAYSGVYVSERKNALFVAGAVAIPAGEGKKPWVLAFERSLRRIYRTVTAGICGSDCTMFIVDSGGRLLAHPDGARAIKRELVAQHPVVQRFLTGRGTEPVRWQDENGDSYAGTFQPLDFLEWAVVIERKMLPLGALGWRVPKWSWILWGAVAALIITAVLLLARRVKRMLADFLSLREAAERRAEELKRIQASVLESGKLSAIGDLGAGVAHEFNNPLGGILGLTQLLLRKKKEDDPDVRFLLRVEEEAKRCKAITDNLLRFSEQQDLTHREPLKLDRALSATVDLITKKLESQRIKVVKNFAADLPRVVGNEGQLQRAFLNIFMNSETAMPEGGMLVVSAQRDGENVVAKISDTGKGIPPENLSRVFEPFFTTKDNWKGAGLGLSVVYQIIKEHEGEVFVTSEPGKGTEVTLRFPAERKAAAGADGAVVPLA